MQQLDKRDTYTPTVIPHDRCNCGPALKDLGGRVGVQDLKTLPNNPDAALTANAQAGRSLRVAAVFVQNLRGEPLMPCKPSKARKLLKGKKAVVACRTPFTIRLLYPTGEAQQDVILGVDSGFTHIGLSAVTSRQEVYAGDIQLRSDIVDLNSERRQYRRARRNRKTWYRKPRFLNRGNKGPGWLAPSIQHKLDSHLKAIGRLRAILPVTRIVVEVAAFDIQKIKNPDVAGVDYQHGEQLGFWNVREYVLHRDRHTCQHCKGRSRDKVLNVHHIQSRKIGGDRPANLITLCKTCHGLQHEGKVDLKTPRTNGFRAETFMSMVRWKLVNQLKETGVPVSHTYGYFTKHKRIRSGLDKSHINDAFVIADGNGQSRSEVHHIEKQVRKCNRKLFKGIRSHIRNTAPRLIKGFQRFDKVLWNGAECFIFGRRSTGYFDLRTLDGNKVHASAKAKDCTLLESARTFLVQRKAALPPLAQARGLRAGKIG